MTRSRIHSFYDAGHVLHIPTDPGLDLDHVWEMAYDPLAQLFRNQGEIHGRNTDGSLTVKPSEKRIEHIHDFPVGPSGGEIAYGSQAPEQGFSRNSKLFKGVHDIPIQLRWIHRGTEVKFPARPRAVRRVGKKVRHNQPVLDRRFAQGFGCLWNGSVIALH